MHLCTVFLLLLPCLMVSRDFVLLLLLFLSCAINRQEEDNKEGSNGNEIKKKERDEQEEDEEETERNGRLPFEWYTLTMGLMQVRHSIHK